MATYGDLLVLPTVACAQLDILNRVLKIQACCTDIKDLLTEPWLRSLMDAAAPPPQLGVSPSISSLSGSRVSGLWGEEGEHKSREDESAASNETSVTE